MGYRLPPLPKHGGYVGKAKRGYQKPTYTPPSRDTVRDTLEAGGLYHARRVYDNLKDRRFAGTAAALMAAGWKHRHNAKRLYDFVKSAAVKRRDRRNNRLNQERAWDQAHTPPRRQINFGHIEPPKLKGKRSARVRGVNQWKYPGDPV